MTPKLRVLQVTVSGVTQTEHAHDATNFGRPYGQFYQKNFDFFYDQQQELKTLKQTLREIKNNTNNAP